MKRNKKHKIVITTVLAASCTGMILQGCAAEGKKADKLIIELIVSEKDEQTFFEADTQEALGKDAQPNSEDTQRNSEDMQQNLEDTQSAHEEPQEAASDSQSLYEQFLNDSIAATVDGSYSEGGYSGSVIENGSSLTLMELESRVSNYYFDSFGAEYTDKTSCDQIQYAYVKCPDSSDETEKNLLVKFVGLDIYTQDDQSYAVFILAENNGRLYITGSYECWARSETTAYENGILRSSGSGGAGDHYDGISVLLSDGKPVSIYDAEILSGWWTSYVNDTIYNEVIDENTVPPDLIVAIYTIGDKKYYQYDMSDCREEEKPLCESYISRCRDEAAINWVSEEEIQTAVQNQCIAVGIDYSIIEQREEAVWNELVTVKQ